MSFLNLFAAAAESLIHFKLSNSFAAVPLKTPQCTELEPSKKIQSSQEESLLSTVPPSEQDSMSDIMKERQRLINQYLQLNIQLMQNQIKQQQVQPQSIPIKQTTRVQPDQQNSQVSDSNKKKIKKINHCGHHDKPHYAKGMCTNCYHRNGRVKKPWKCSHEKLYAAGLCQNCYINNYNRKRREQVCKIQEKHEENQSVSHDLSMEKIQKRQPSEQN